MANSHTLWDRLQPQDVMSRHRGAKLRRRYELLGGISLLSPEYLLSVERWPFHTEPPDHYDLLSHLLDLSVSQSSLLLPLHYQYDVRPYLEDLRTPPLPFGRRPPQSNCLPCTSPARIHGPGLEPQRHQGGISRTAPPELASRFHSLPPILHKSRQSPICKAAVKVHGVFPSSRGEIASSQTLQLLAESQEETVWPSLRHSCRSELTRQGISLP